MVLSKSGRLRFYGTSSWSALAAIALVAALAFMGIYAFNSWNSSESRAPGSQAIDEAGQSNGSPGIFLIYGQGGARKLVPMVEYELSNGSVITVYKSNPFPFEVKLSSNASVSAPSTITVYKVVPLSSGEEVLELASKLGVDAESLAFNSETGTYIFHNETHTFEYRISNGYVRLAPRSISGSGGSFPPDEVLVSKALEYLKARGLLYMSDYRVHVGDYLVRNGSPVLKAVRVEAVIDGVEAGNLGLVVILNSRGEVVGLEGIVLARLEAVGQYRVKQLSHAIEELRDKIKSGASMTDWYINWLAFTELRIENVTIKYHLNTEGYLIPVFIMRGSYTLDYDEIHDSGQVEAVIVAIEAD